MHTYREAESLGNAIDLTFSVKRNSVAVKQDGTQGRRAERPTIHADIIAADAMFLPILRAVLRRQPADSMNSQIEL
jgi:hypothetical protein